MSATKLVHRKKRAGAAAVYHGKQARTGNSLGFRFDRALFQSHPEFSGEVTGHVIAPGRMLVVAEQMHKLRGTQEDPVLASFLSFLANDIARSPEKIRPFSRNLAARMKKAVGHVAVDPSEDLGDASLL